MSSKRTLAKDLQAGDVVIGRPPTVRGGNTIAFVYVNHAGRVTIRWDDDTQSVVPMDVPFDVYVDDEAFTTVIAEHTDTEQRVLYLVSHIIQLIPDEALAQVLDALADHAVVLTAVAVAEGAVQAVADAKADADETLGDVVAWRSEVFDGSTMLSFTEWQEDRRLLHPRRPENQA